MFRLTVVTLLGLSAAAIGQTTQPDALAVEFEAIRRTDLQKVGRDVVVHQYEQFIARAGDDPRRVDAMLAIAGIYRSIAIPEQGIKQDPEAALHWARKAVAAAKVGSPQWVEGNFAVAGHLRWTAAPEARRLYGSVAETLPNNPLVQIQVESHLMGTYDSKDLDKIEEHAYRILGWYDDPKRIPKYPDEKREVDGAIINAFENLADSIFESDLSGEQKLAKLDKLLKQYGVFDTKKQQVHEKVNRLRAQVQPAK
jgi:hypothetical protein